MADAPEPFGRYLLLERIAVGGMAEIFKAKARGAASFEKVVAVKRILPNFSDSREFVEMFIDEANIAATLTHANICQIYELGEVDALHYIAMEYVDGRDLQQITARLARQHRTVPPPIAARICSEVLRGMAYAHNKSDASGKPLGIIHRDVTPSNVIVTFEGGVKVIDFGIAKARNKISKTRSGALKGKFCYLPPEAVRGKEVDYRSDLYQVGLILYELLTLRRAFDGRHEVQVLERIRAGKVIPPSQYVALPPQLEKIVLKALEANPDDRFQRATDFESALAAYLATCGSPVTSSTLSQFVQQVFPDRNAPREPEEDDWEEEETVGLRKRGFLPGVRGLADRPAGERPQRPVAPGMVPGADRPSQALARAQRTGAGSMSSSLSGSMSDSLSESMSESVSDSMSASFASQSYSESLAGVTVVPDEVSIPGQRTTDERSVGERSLPGDTSPSERHSLPETLTSGESDLGPHDRSTAAGPTLNGDLWEDREATQIAEPSFHSEATLLIDRELLPGAPPDRPTTDGDLDVGARLPADEAGSTNVGTLEWEPRTRPERRASEPERRPSRGGLPAGSPASRKRPQAQPQPQPTPEPQAVAGNGHAETTIPPEQLDESDILEEMATEEHRAVDVDALAAAQPGRPSIHNAQTLQLDRGGGTGARAGWEIWVARVGATLGRWVMATVSIVRRVGSRKRPADRPPA